METVSAGDENFFFNFRNKEQISDCQLLGRVTFGGRKISMIIKGQNE